MNGISWKGSNKQVEKQLVAQFENLGIDYSNPGFCDDPNFLRQEKKDPRFLEKYALYVESKHYEDEYLERAKKSIIICAESLHKAIKKDGRLGACVDVSSMLSRMLEELGIWSYVTNSAVKIDLPQSSKIKPIWFWSPSDGSGMAAAHAIVVAPPFAIVDLTIKMQPYQPGVNRYLPEIALVTDYTNGQWEPEDVIEHDTLNMYGLSGDAARKAIQSQLRPMYEVMNTFPCRIATFGETHIKYTTIAIGGSLEPLSGILGYKPNGQTALEIFQNDIIPRLS